MLALVLQLSSLAKTLADLQSKPLKKTGPGKPVAIAAPPVHGPVELPSVETAAKVGHPLFNASTLQSSADPKTNSLLLEARIEAALETHQGETHLDVSRAGVVQQAYAVLLAEVQANPSINMAPYAERFAQIQVMERTWEATSALRESKPGLFYMTKHDGELLPGNNPWIGEKSKGLLLDHSEAKFEQALSSHNPTDVKVALDAARDIQGRLHLMLQLDGAREMLKSMSDTTVQTGEVPLLPMYVAPKDKDLAQLHLDGISQNIFELAFELYVDDACEDIAKMTGQQVCDTSTVSHDTSGTDQYGRSYSGTLATLNINQLNSTPAQRAFIQLLNDDPQEAIRVQEAFKYLRYHQESKLITPGKTASSIGEAKMHLATLKRFSGWIQRAQRLSYSVSESTNQDLIQPAVSDMKRFDQLGLILGTVEGEKQFASQPVELAKTLLGDLSDAETRMNGVSSYHDNDDFVNLVTRGWYGDPSSRPEDSAHVVYEFFRQFSTNVDFDTTKLNDAERTSHFNRSDMSGGTAEIEKKYPELAISKSSTIHHLRTKLADVVSGDIKGAKAVGTLVEVLGSLREMRQKALVMELAVQKLSPPTESEDGPTEAPDIAPGHDDAIAWINATGQLTDNITLVATGKPLKLAKADTYKQELQGKIDKFRKQLREVRSELKTGGLGWNWGQGDYHISTASLDDLLQRLDGLHDRLSPEDMSEDEIAKIRGEWNHLVSAPVVNYIYTGLKHMKRMNGWRDIAYEGILTAPLALGGAFAARGLVSAALARTGLAATSVGRFLLLGSEALGLTLAGDAAHAMIGHHGAPLTGAEQEGFSFVERLGMSMGMLKFFHSALRFAGPLATRKTQAVAVRLLLRKGNSLAFLFGTTSGRTLLMRTMARNIIAQAPGAAIRMGSSYAGFTAWDFIANNYQIVRTTGEFKPGAALQQTVSLDSLRSRAIMVPMFAMYGQLIRPMARYTAKRQMARHFAKNPGLENKWIDSESRIVEARDQFEKLMAETEGGLKADKDQIERVNNELRDALKTRQELESELPDGIISPQEKAITEKTLEVSAEFEANLGQINQVLGKGNVHGVVTNREGQSTFPAERSAEIQQALIKSGADVRVHRNGVISVNKGLIRLVPSKSRQKMRQALDQAKLLEETHRLEPTKDSVEVHSANEPVVATPKGIRKISRLAFDFIDFYRGREKRTTLRALSASKGPWHQEALRFREALNELRELMREFKQLMKENRSRPDSKKRDEARELLHEKVYPQLIALQKMAVHEAMEGHLKLAAAVESKLIKAYAALTSAEIQARREANNGDSPITYDIRIIRPEEVLLKRGDGARELQIEDAVQIDIEVGTSKELPVVLKSLQRFGLKVESSELVWKLVLGKGQSVPVSVRIIGADAVRTHRDVDAWKSELSARINVAEIGGTEKIANLLRMAPKGTVAREKLDSLVQFASDAKNPDLHIRQFLKESTMSEILLLIRSDINSKGLENILVGDPASHVKRIESIKDSTTRNVLLAITAQREFRLQKNQPNRKSSAGRELLARFGIDPAEHKVFPWNSRDTMSRASLYFRVKGASSELIATLARALPGREAEVKELADIIWQLIMIQDVKDTKLPFTPHGWAHTLDVAHIQRDIYMGSPALREALIKEFGNEARALALLDVVALMHDVGYGQLNGAPKGKHAIYSGQAFKEVLADGLKRAFGLSDKQLNDVFLAIERHGADKVRFSDEVTKHYKLSNRQVEDILLIVHNHGGNKTSSAPVIKAKYGISEAHIDSIFQAIKRSGYMAASAEAQPLLFAIRLADNLDSSVNRLRNIQTNAYFIEALKKMNDLQQNPKFNKETEGEMVQAVRDEYENIFTAQMAPHDAKLAIELLQNMNHFSWPHFKGCKTVSKVTIREKNSKLVVDFFISGLTNIGRVVEKTIRGPLDVDGSLYQLWRAYASAKSMSYKGEGINFRYSTNTATRGVRRRRQFLTGHFRLPSVISERIRGDSRNWRRANKISVPEMQMTIAQKLALTKHLVTEKGWKTEDLTHYLGTEWMKALSAMQPRPAFLQAESKN